MIRWTDVADVRRRIALALLPSRSVPPTLGDVTLEPHQREAAQRLGVMIARHGGALLADVVGSGKTYTALAVARSATLPLIVAPAALRDTWAHALSVTDVRARIVSLESLSRGTPAIDVAADLVIVDESHHLRNSATRRYRRIAALCASANVLLLSATPLQNRTADLASQLALYLGERAHAMSDAELASHVVRRGRLLARMRLPSIDGPHWVEVPLADDWLDDLLALPPVVGPADGGDGGALLGYVLVRRWASSRAALLATLRRRLAAAIALESALDVGRRPTKRELVAWRVADDAMQLAFPELVATGIDAGNGVVDADSLLPAVRAHRDAVRELMTRIRAAPDPDVERALALARLMDVHEGETLIAFSEHAETVSALAAHLMPLGGVVCLTSHGARAASGRLTRNEVLRQLEPGARSPPAAERIRLLLSTDVLSEGVNLQRASVVVHIDLPWNPARLEQRVGRVRRLGSSYGRVAVYAMSPPANAERLCDVEQRLRRKLDVAARAIGVSGRILPPPWGCMPSEVADSHGEPELENEIVELLRHWLVNEDDPCAQATRTAPSPLSGVAGDVLCASVELPVGEAPLRLLALIRIGEDLQLLADIAGITTDPRDVRRAILLASEDRPRARDVVQRDCDDVVACISRWCEAREASLTIGAASRRHESVSASSVARRKALARLARIGANVPRQSRAAVAPVIERARAAVALPMTLGVEHVLGEIVDAPLDDHAWLQAINGFAHAHRPTPSERSTGAPPSAPPYAILALILFRAARP